MSNPYESPKHKQNVAARRSNSVGLLFWLGIVLFLLAAAGLTGSQALYINQKATGEGNQNIVATVDVVSFIAGVVGLILIFSCWGGTVVPNEAKVRKRIEAKYKRFISTSTEIDEKRQEPLEVKAEIGEPQDKAPDGECGD